MSLDDFLTDNEKLGDNYKSFLKMKEKFLKDGLPENIATYKATWVLTPQKLEKIKLYTHNEDGLRVGITFFFDSQEELVLLSKYFNMNPNTKQVKEAPLLIQFLKLLEELDEQSSKTEKSNTVAR